MTRQHPDVNEQTLVRPDGCLRKSTLDRIQIVMDWGGHTPGSNDSNFLYTVHCALLPMPEGRHWWDDEDYQRYRAYLYYGSGIIDSRPHPCYTRPTVEKNEAADAALNEMEAANERNG
jgi:hypothetical protein